MSWGCSHMKAWLGLEDPLPSLPSWQWAGGSAPRHVGLYIGLFECFHYMATGFLHCRQKDRGVLYDNLQSHTITSVFFSSEVSHYVQPTLKGKEIRLPLLQERASKNLWGHFKTKTITGGKRKREQWRETDPSRVVRLTGW